MKKKHVWLLPLAVLALSTPVMTSCSNDLSEDSHYKTPDWLKGNAYEVLQKEGNYSIFLRGIDLVDDAGIVNGKSLVTVAAPNDDAFRTFLQEKGYGSIDEMYQANPQYVKNLIKMHLMYYAFDWDKMVNFRPSEGDGATAEEKNRLAGCYYKHRTHSQDAIENITVPNVDDAKLYHYERYLPVFSNLLFQTKNIDAAYNYNYFYPNTQWWGVKSSGDGFNIANAAVDDENNVITDNGYLYHVDKVIEPLNTIYDELKSSGEYSDFLSLYDKYAVYEQAYDETNTALGFVAYVKSHGALPPIASEWPIGSKSGTIVSKMTLLEHDGYNIFAPTNEALAKFFQTFWKPEDGYTSLSNLDPKISEYFIKQMFTDNNFIAFPEEIKKGNVKTSFGTEVNFNPDNIAQNRRKICCNGTLYGMDEMTAPAIFSSVVAPAFKCTKFVDYLYCLDASKLVPSLASTQERYITLIPSNEQFTKADPEMRLYTTVNGNELQEYSTEASSFVGVSDKTKLDFVNIHTSDNAAELPTSGIKVLSTYAPFNYWFVKDGAITTNALFNEQLEPTYTGGSPFCAFHELKNGSESWSNGKSYSYDATSLFKKENGDGLLYKLSLYNDVNYEYNLFSQLLNKAGMISGGKIKFPTDDLSTSDRRVIVFVPTNDVIKANLASIPGCSKLTIGADGLLAGTLSADNKTLLQSWLLLCFASTEENSVITDYPFIGSICNNKNLITKALTSQIKINDDGTKLSVRLVGSETEVPVSSKYSYFPFAFNDGCMHFVEGILK